MQVKDSAVVFGAVLSYVLLLVGFAHKGQEVSVQAGGSFDDIGRVALVSVFLVDVRHVLSACLCVLAKVKVCAVVDAFDFLKADREVVLNVVGVLGVVGQLVVVVPLQVLFGDAVLKVEGPAVLAPVLKNSVVCSGLAEVLHFHLLKFASAEDEVLKDDFVAEGLSNLGHAKGKLHS